MRLFVQYILSLLLLFFVLEAESATFRVKCHQDQCSSEKITLTDQGLQCENGHEYQAVQVLSSLSPAGFVIQLPPVVTVTTPGQASPLERIGSITHLRRLLVAFITFVQSVTPLSVTSGSIVRQLQYQSETERSRITRDELFRQNILDTPSLNPNILLQIYNSLTFSNIQQPPATATSLGQAAQLALAFYILSQQAEPNCFNLSGEAKIDQAIRLWLLVKMWMRILLNQSIEDPVRSHILTQSGTASTNQQILDSLNKLHALPWVNSHNFNLAAWINHHLGQAQPNSVDIYSVVGYGHLVVVTLHQAQGLYPGQYYFITPNGVLVSANSQNSLSILYRLLGITGTPAHDDTGLRLFHSNIYDESPDQTW